MCVGNGHCLLGGGGLDAGLDDLGIFYEKRSVKQKSAPEWPFGGGGWAMPHRGSKFQIP